jgi:DNA modification methylase
MLIQGMRSMRLVPSITIFKPTIAKYICEKYSNPGDIVGDYSCGFGGRLLGAMSSGRKYIGTDPLTTPELQEMIKFYGFKDCTVIQSGSEDYCGDKNSVDLYWSSPPYFDQEVYSKDMTQSYNRGKDYFYNVYWKKTLENVKFMLKPGKWFGTNIKNQLMLDIAKEYFGEPEEIINLKTVRSHLTKGAGTIKYEYVYLFKNE